MSRCANSVSAAFSRRPAVRGHELGTIIVWSAWSPSVTSRHEILRSAPILGKVVGVRVKGSWIQASRCAGEDQVGVIGQAIDNIACAIKQQGFVLAIGQREARRERIIDRHSPFVSESATFLNTKNLSLGMMSGAPLFMI